MSRFHGRQGPGALQRHRDRLYDEALARQVELIRRGSYPRAVRLRDGKVLAVIPTEPAPLSLFERGARLPASLAELLQTADPTAVISDGR